MVGQRDMDAYRNANKTLDEKLSADLSAFWGSLDLADRDGVRTAVLDAGPVLVEQYGSMGAAVSAEFFEDAVDATPVLGDGLNVEKIQASARWAIGPLWEDDPDLALSQLTASLVRHARFFGRETIHLSTVQARGVSYAWVPGDLCPYCVEFGSRGLVFGRSTSLEALHFHDSCTCNLVPARTVDDLPPGYSPADLKALLADQG